MDRENLIRYFQFIGQELKQLNRRKSELCRIIYGMQIRDPELIGELELIRHNIDIRCEISLEIHNLLESLQ